LIRRLPATSRIIAVTDKSDSSRNTPFVILASASPRRQELLGQIGVSFQTVVPDVDETPRENESADAFVERLAVEKARNGLLLASELGMTNAPVLGADTCIVFDGEILGKPVDRDHGIAMLARLAGHSHEVLTGVALVDASREQHAISRNRVTFAPMTPDEIAAYWDTGEAADKAGAYGVQGKAAAYIERIEGSYSGIVGLPLFEVAGMLKNLGMQL
jgi:septum formation protein